MPINQDLYAGNEIERRRPGRTRALLEALQ